MNKIQCNNCGGNLSFVGGDVWKCDYCGTQYKIDAHIDHELKINVIKPGCRVVKARFDVAHEFLKMMPEEEQERMVKTELAEYFKQFMLEHFDEMFDMYVNTDYATMKKCHVAVFRYLDKTGMDIFESGVL